jgi:hypothetical protein
MHPLKNVALHHVWEAIAQEDVGLRPTASVLADPFATPRNPSRLSESGNSFARPNP